jgi:2-hydroxycyclohexanecarboxyl-CoA dehydrogenase
VRRFEQQVAIVTGGASGIGLAVVERLSTEGAHVALVDVDAERAEAAAEGLQHNGVVAMQGDVTDAAAMRRIATQVTEKFSTIDVLVSNAGWDRAMAFVDCPEEVWDRVIAVNYRGHLASTQAVMGTMIAKGSGRIVTVASDAGRVGSSGEAVYSGAKGAVIAFSKALAREVARYGINVNCVAPGLVDTPMLAGISGGNEKLIDAIVRAIPFRRTGKPAEIASAICYLASSDAAYITGQTLSVNGGLTMV